MAVEEIHIGDTGTSVDLTILDAGVALNLTGATITFYFRRPNLSTFSRPATIASAATGLARYVTVAIDFDASGTWHVQALVSFSGTEAWRTKLVRFLVHANA